MSNSDELSKLKANRDFWNTKMNEANSSLKHINERIAELQEAETISALRDKVIADKDEQLAYILRAFCWLQSPQPTDAIVDHLGLNTEKLFSFCGMHAVAVGVIPVTSAGKPGIVFSSRFNRRKPGITLYQLFNKEALDYCRMLITTFAPIADEWNGLNGNTYLDTFSISPAIRISDGILNARQGYSKHFTFDYSDRFRSGMATLQKPLGWR